jgi:hypothetical protein
MRPDVQAALTVIGRRSRERDIRSIDLTGRAFHPVEVPYATLVGATLTRALFIKADLTGADLTGADLACADLNGANLKGANLALANLTDANLTDANLTDAALETANKTGANFTRPGYPEMRKILAASKQDTGTDPLIVTDIDPGPGRGEPFGSAQLEIEDVELVPVAAGEECRRAR